jgi:hypothetical protein
MKATKDPEGRLSERKEGNSQNLGIPNYHYLCIPLLARESLLLQIMHKIIVFFVLVDTSQAHILSDINLLRVQNVHPFRRQQFPACLRCPCATCGDCLRVGRSGC